MVVREVKAVNMGNRKAMDTAINPRGRSVCAEVGLFVMPSKSWHFHGCRSCRTWYVVYGSPCQKRGKYICSTCRKRAK
jgi:hypothetical protein